MIYPLHLVIEGQFNIELVALYIQNLQTTEERDDFYHQIRDFQDQCEPTDYTYRERCRMILEAFQIGCNYTPAKIKRLEKARTTGGEIALQMLADVMAHAK